MQNMITLSRIHESSVVLISETIKSLTNISKNEWVQTMIYEGGLNE